MKKVTPVKAGVKIAPKPLYSIQNEVHGADSYNNSIKVLKEASGLFTINLTFDCSPIPFCCGIAELGNFGLRNGRNSGVCPKEIKLQAIKEGLAELIRIETFKDKSKTFIISLINNLACNLIREAIQDEELFTKVKTFKNTTGNVIDVWMSNN